MLSDGVPVAVVVADRACRGLDVAAQSGIPGELVDRLAYGGFGAAFDREGYTERIVEVLRPFAIDLVAMSGFGTVLGQAVQDAYGYRILNTHPSLLPAFPGWHAVEDALTAGVAVTGCTVHQAQLEVDAGPVLAQREVPVLPDDTVETLHDRIKEVEQRLYPATIQLVLGKLAEGCDPETLTLELAEVAEAIGGAASSSASGSASGRKGGSR
jgi:phosphoribosylglycinamide formyltransferase-1